MKEKMRNHLMSIYLGINAINIVMIIVLVINKATFIDNFEEHMFLYDIVIGCYGLSGMVQIIGVVLIKEFKNYCTMMYCNAIFLGILTLPLIFMIGELMSILIYRI